MDEKTYSLCEAVADIAYIAGNKKYYSGDSRADIRHFIELATEFEQLHKDTVWGQELDYITEITKFADSRI